MWALCLKPSAVCAASLITFALVASGQTATLSLSSTSGATGSTVSMPLAFASNGAQAAGIQWAFSYAAADFSNVSVAAGPSASTAGKTVTCNSPSSGQYICLISGLNANTIPDGTIATANFTVSGTTSSTSSAIQVLNTSATSGSGSVIASAASGATITINNTQSSTSLAGLSCNPSSLTAPGSSQCTVSLSGPAPSGGAAVSIGVTSTAATVSAPSSVTVPAGAASAQFGVQITAATALTSVQISASLNSRTLTSTINVAPPVGIAVAVSPASATLAPGGSQRFSASVTGTSTTAVTWSLSSPIGSISSTGLYVAPTSVSTQQTVTIRATSAADTTKYGTATVVINPASSPTPVSTGVSFWSDSITPGTASSTDSNSVEVGLKFSSSLAGTVTGVRFYKGSNNTGTHVGHLWTSNGTLVASVTFTNETASGWQQANFSTPVQITADTVYVVSYFAPNAGYASDEYFGWSNVSASPLAVSGSSPGVFAYSSASSFPTSDWHSSNYWVDVVFNTASVQPAPTVAVAVSPSSATLAPGGSQRFTATVTGTSNTAVTWSLSAPVGAISSTGLYVAPTSVSTQQTVTVRATSVADLTKSASATVVVNPTTPTPTSTAVSFWLSNTTPGTAMDPDTSSTEVGLRFLSSVAGSITGVRFYKGPSNTGTHVGHLWTSTGTLLASVTFTNETSSGWQQANFSTPVQINPNTVYVVSYNAPNGAYADDQYFGWSGLSATPLSVSGSTPGVYAYGSGAVFPTDVWNTSNYWVDVAFSPAQ